MHNWFLNNFIEQNEGDRLRIKSRHEMSVYDFENFDKLTDKRKEELKTISDDLKRKFITGKKIGKNYYKILLYLYNNTWQSTNNKKNERIYTSEEIIAIIIETVDPTLKLFKISRRCKTEYQLEVISNQIFGFYDCNLINYEEEYAKRFYKTNRDVLKKKLGI